MKKKNLFRGLTSALALITCIVLGFSIAAFNSAPVINNFLGISTNRLVLRSGLKDINGDGKIDENDVEKPQYFTSKYAADINNVTEAELAKKDADVAAFVETEMEEGAVLLKNDNDALPLSKGAKVSCFGRATVNPYRKGNSGGGRDGIKLSYLEAMEDQSRAAFQINPVLVEAYNNDTSPLRSATNRIIGESPKSVYTQTVLDSFGEYSDAAIVMLSREAGESNDLYTKDKDGISQLALHQDEKDMLEIVKQYKANGTFSKIIVLLNSGHPMEVKWLDEYDVDACMLIGGAGNNTGFYGVPDLLVGNVNPSGRLVETYASNSLSAPATINMGEFSYPNYVEVANGITDNASDCVYYVVQAEGIYVGYKYYETRYEDCILGQGNADGSAGVFDSTNNKWNYAEEVSYPFGYGISYTTFEQKLGSVTMNDNGTTTVKGTVKNTGSVAGKSVVELYAQTPYGKYEKDNKVEKASIQLVGFTKTDLIQPNATVDFEITFDNYFLASYDYTNAKGYILSEGDYYLAIGNDAHDALNNILAAKKATGMITISGEAATGDASQVYSWKQDKLDTETYAYSTTGYRVTNQLDEADINYYIDDCVTYLTRNDWQGTFPTEATVITANQKLIETLCDDRYEKPSDAPSAYSITLGAKNGIKLADMWGVPYEDKLWSDFIDQMTLDELVHLTMENGGCGEVLSLNSPATKNGDGPDGIVNNAYVNESLAAASWSKEMLAKRGYYLAEDAVMSHLKHEVWCPGLDMHRTPFGGRNFEYYSEDPILSYELSAAETVQMENMGVSVGPKHFFANDQETWRTGVSTYGNEQAFREFQLRAFEGCFVKGGATSVMSSFNRIGPVWIGHYTNVQDNILRGEWGFNGFVITDAAGINSYMHTVATLMNGTELFCNTSGSAGDGRIKEIYRQINATDDGNIVLHLKEIAHRVFYTYSHTNLMNGLTSAYDVESATPWWQPFVIGVNIALWLGVAVLCAFFMVHAYGRKKEKRGEE